MAGADPKGNLDEQAVLTELRREVERVSRELSLRDDRIDHYETVLAPRLRSILTLQPLRYAWRARQRAKRGEPPFADTPSPPGTQENTPTAGGFSPTKPHGEKSYPGFGVAVFGHTRLACMRNMMESLARQDALSVTHVFIDGDQGGLGRRARVDAVEAVVRDYPVAGVHRQRGAFGFRKMMLLAGKAMMREFDHIVFLEDDCFPVDGAIDAFAREIDAIAGDPSIFSVYGHPFLVEAEDDYCARFQGWGWGTTREKLAPIWRRLEECYLMNEPDYLSFVRENTTDDLLARLDVTPGRQPSDVFSQFFAWDETVCLLTGLADLKHKKSDKRLIYNCGVGGEAGHFNQMQHYREPPFNMISENEVWDYFQSN